LAALGSYFPKWAGLSAGWVNDVVIIHFAFAFRV